MAKMTQLTVSCQNNPGALAEIAGIVGKANVNILAFNVGSAGTMGYVQIHRRSSQPGQEKTGSRRIFLLRRASRLPYCPQCSRRPFSAGLEVGC